jgi:hypothetical protein
LLLACLGNGKGSYKAEALKVKGHPSDQVTSEIPFLEPSSSLKKVFLGEVNTATAIASSLRSLPTLFLSLATLLFTLSLILFFLFSSPNIQITSQTTVQRPYTGIFGFLFQFFVVDVVHDWFVLWVLVID